MESSFLQLTDILKTWIGLQKPEQCVVDWNSVFDLATLHRVRPQLLSYLSTFSDKPRIYPTLQEDCRQNQFFGLLLLQQLSLLESDFLAANLSVIPFKGIILAQSLYGDVGAREQGDLDLFIQSNDFALVQEILKKHRFFPEPVLAGKHHQQYLKYYPEYLFSGNLPNGENLEIDVHWAVGHKIYCLDFPLSFLTDLPINRFDATATALILTLHHGAKEQWNHLKLLLDWALLVHQKQKEIDWDKIIWKLKQATLLNIFRIGCSLIHTLFHLEQPYQIVLVSKKQLEPYITSLMNKPHETHLGRLQTIYRRAKIRDTRIVRWQIYANMALHFLNPRYTKTGEQESILQRPKRIWQTFVNTFLN